MVVSMLCAVAAVALLKLTFRHWGWVISWFVMRRLTNL